MPIRLLRYLILLLCIPFAVAATEIDYKQIQIDLNSMGYNVGVADGIPGRNTKEGIKNFFNDAGYVTPSEITDGEQSFIRGVAAFTSKPLGLMREVITRQVTIKDLSDEQLCELNLHLDLEESFYEIKRRELGCPSGTENIIRYDGEFINDPIRLLRDFQKAQKIEIPIFDLTSTNLFSDWGETKKNYYFLNPKFGELLDQGRNRISYCADWMPQIGSVPPDPSKNLDGTGSWANDTIRDGFVICQNSLNALYLGALSLNETVASRSIKQFQNILETWVKSDGGNNLPFRPYHSEYNREAAKADPNFTYLITISKLMTGAELLQSQLNWTFEEKSRYAAWAKDRILQRLPVGGRMDILENSICDLNVQKDKMNDSCMNAAPFVAQGLLRAAIAGDDQELAELSYLVFKQYSSALRPDGSQAHDSLRDCYAADYTIWASEFLHDYIYLASTAGVDLWDDRFSPKHGSPKENVEYALRVVSDPNVVNEYAQDFGYPDCEESQGQIVQKVSNYPRSAFAYYLKTFKPGNLDDIYLENRSDLWSYTGASGINYEVDLLNKNPEIQSYFTRNEEGILNSAGNTSPASTAVTGSIGTTSSAPTLTQDGKTLTVSGEAGGTVTILDGRTDVTSKFDVTESSGTYTAIAKSGEFDGSESLSLTATITDRRALSNIQIELNTSDRVESLNWYIALRDEGFQNILEAQDTLIFSEEGNLVASSHENVSVDGIGGRQNLTYSFQNNAFMIKGTVTVLGDEQVSINVEELIETGKATIIFGGQDKLIISWTD